MSKFIIRIGLAAAVSGLGVVAAVALAPAAADAQTPTSAPSNGGPSIGLGGLPVAVGGGTVTVGPVSVNVPGTVTGVGSTVNKTVGGLTGGSAAPVTPPPTGGGASTPPPPKHVSSTPSPPPAKNTDPVRQPNRPQSGSTHRPHVSRAGTVPQRVTTQQVRSRPRDIIRTPGSKASSRPGKSQAAEHRLATLVDRAIPHPGTAVLMLLASTAILAISVMSLLVFVGRRPDPRVAASESRLRSALTW